MQVALGPGLNPGHWHWMRQASGHCSSRRESEWFARICLVPEPQGRSAHQLCTCSTCSALHCVCAGRPEHQELQAVPR
jgi:hypothetical protein